MPPKKNAKKGEEDEDTGQEKIAQLQLKVKALEMKFVEEQDLACLEKAKENESYIKVLDLENDFKKEQEKLFSITSDMTRQFKQMQDQKVNELNNLNQLITQKIDVIQKKSEQIEDMQNDFNSKLKKKDEDIVELRKKIEDMSNEFARMLKETLDKMQERVDQAQWDNDTDPYMIKKLKEIAIKDT